MIIYMLSFEHVHYVIVIADHLLGVTVHGHVIVQYSFISIYILCIKGAKKQPNIQLSIFSVLTCLICPSQDQS